MAAQIRTAIARGALAPGAMLPSTRTLGAELGFSRGTVVAAYQELTDSGWVWSRVGSGTVVADPGAAAPERQQVAVDAASQPLSRSPWRPADGAVRWDLTPGRPDLASLPREQWLRAEQEGMRSLTTHDFGYPDPAGDPVLREEVAAMLRRTRGMEVGPGQVIITAGVSQATALVLEVLRREGATTLAVEDPGSRGLHEHVRHWGLEPRPIPVDGEGLTTGTLGSESGVLLTPAHQFPTGVVLSAERRWQVITWARRTGAVVIEDDYDAEHRYDRAPVTALHALAPDCTAYVGSVSKTIAPGLRLGWLVPPPVLLARLVAHKDASDRGSAVLPQRTLAVLLARGQVARHLRRVRSRQRQRRDALIDGLAAHRHEGQIHGVAAGLHLLLALPDGVDDIRVAQELVEQGVLVDALSTHRIRRGPPGLVIGYAAHTVDDLREAGAIIAEAIGRHRSRPNDGRVISRADSRPWQRNDGAAR